MGDVDIEADSNVLGRTVVMPSSVRLAIVLSLMQISL